MTQGQEGGRGNRFGLPASLRRATLPSPADRVTHAGPRSSADAETVPIGAGFPLRDPDVD